MAASLAVAGGNAQADTNAIPICPTVGELSVYGLPTGLNVHTCDVEGVVVTYDGTGMEMPEADTAVSIDVLSEDGTEHGFTLIVTSDGKVSYDLSEANTESPTAGEDRADVVSPRLTPGDLTEESDSSVSEPPAPDGLEVAEVDAVSSPGECQDGAYSNWTGKSTASTTGTWGTGPIPRA
ncbi:hypothetical protein [Streptomyces prasinus]|uniref:hypothetical protein n=1 Tax=Streptomyces prasinus TaxID=67345 RepID=UPI002F404051